MAEILNLENGSCSYQIPVDRIFTEDGCWLKAKGCIVRMGVGDYLQAQAGELLRAELKDSGFLVKRNLPLGKLYGEQSQIDLIAPLTGKLRLLNPLLRANPALINQDPYEQGWIYEMETFDWDEDRAELLSPIAYLNLMRRRLAGEED